MPSGTKSDLTDRKRIRDALKISEIRYRRLFETAKDGILILDADTGQITDANPFLMDMLGYSHAELLGKMLWEIGPFRDIAASRLSTFLTPGSSATKDRAEGTFYESAMVR